MSHRIAPAPVCFAASALPFAFAFALLWVAPAARAIERGELAGTWEHYDAAAGETYRFTLNADGTGTVDGEPVTFTVRGSKVRVKTADDVLEYTVSLKGNVLTVSGGDFDAPTAFTRKGKAPRKSVPAPAPVAAPKEEPPAEGEPAENEVAAQDSKTEKTEANDEAKPRAKKASGKGLVGTWKSDEGLVTFNEDGTCTFLGRPAKYKVEGEEFALTGEKGTVKIGFALDGDTLTLRGSGYVATLTRRDDAEAAAMEKSPAVGVWVAEEASLDPGNFLSFTQYLAILPDGTVHWDKAEGGATRRQVNDYLARTVIHHQGRSGFQNHGRWEADGAGGIVIYWKKWNNLVTRGRISGGSLRLEKMGVLEEGATLEFKKQQQ